MIARSGRILLVSLLAACVVVVSAGASVSQSRPAGSPDLAAMALRASDIARGTRVDSQGYVRTTDYLASYERDFDVPGTRLGRTPLLAAYETLDVARTLGQAQSEFATLAGVLRGTRGRQLVKEIFVSQGIPSDSVAVGTIRRPKIGHGTIYIPITLTRTTGSGCRSRSSSSATTASSPRSGSSARPNGSCMPPTRTA
jgi:hypothetical protein